MRLQPEHHRLLDFDAIEQGGVFINRANQLTEASCSPGGGSFANFR